jgi:hypothetical protein
MTRERIPALFVGLASCLLAAAILAQSPVAEKVTEPGLTTVEYLGFGLLVGCVVAGWTSADAEERRADAERTCPGRGVTTWHVPIDSPPNRTGYSVSRTSYSPSRTGYSAPRTVCSRRRAGLLDV